MLAGQGGRGAGGEGRGGAGVKTERSCCLFAKPICPTFSIRTTKHTEKRGVGVEQRGVGLEWVWVWVWRSYFSQSSMSETLDIGQNVKALHFIK